MSANQSNSSGGAHASSGGTSETIKQTGLDEEVKPPQHVAFESFQKVLDEKKREAEKVANLKKTVDALLAEKKEREEEELRKRGDTEKLLKLREEELQKEREEKQRLVSNIQGGLKLDAVLNTISGKVDKKYWNLINLDEIVIDPNTGTPDGSSVQSVARQFESMFPEVISRASGMKLPNDAPKNGSGKLSIEEWSKLGSAKEMRARLSEVYSED